MDQDVLTALRHRQWLYGLELLDKLNQNRPKELGFGSLYPALNRLDKKGLVDWKWGEEDDASGGARRKYYQITGFGLSSLLSIERYRESLGQPTPGGLVPDGV